MNIKHIQYVVEIERVRSISQAAENLYIGQPNLSRILREMEQDVGFPIFIRTTHGVRPTERGEVFLQHAHNILREMESIRMMSPHQMVEDRLRICIPRSAVVFQMVSDFLKGVCETQNVNIEIRECHAKKTLDSLAAGHAEIGIIRFREGYEEYFQELAKDAKLTYRTLSSYEDVILMHSSHPLANRQKIKADDLLSYIQITHSDNNFRPSKIDDAGSSQIYTVDRHAQLTLLKTMPGSYMWSVPQDKKMLAASGLVQKRCSGYSRRYCEAIVYNPMHTMNRIESELLNRILARETN